jgi:hypothetical protein
MVSLVGLCLLVACPCTKSAPTMQVTRTNPHPEAPACPSTPKVLQAKEHTPTPYHSIIFTLDLYLSLSRNLGVHHS